MTPTERIRAAYLRALATQLGRIGWTADQIAAELAAFEAMWRGETGQAKE